MRKISTQLITITMSIVLLLSLSSLLVWIVVSENIKKTTLITTKEILLNDYKQLIKSEVETVISYLEYNHNVTVKKGISQEVAMKFAANYIRELRYGKEGYFWCDDSKGNNIILLGNEKVEGKNRIEFTDRKGAKIMKKIINIAKKQHEGFLSFWFPKKGGNEAFEKIAYVKYFEPYDWIIGTGNYVDEIESKVLEMEAEQTSIFSKSQVVFVLVILCLVAISIFVSLAMSKKISTPIVEISNNASEIAKGNLKTTFKEYETLELMILSKSMNSMATNLNNLVSKIKIGADQLRGASEEIHKSSENLSQDASEQAASTEEISSTMEQMTSNIQQNTDNSKTTKTISQKAKNDILEVSDNAGKVQNAVNLINKKITIINDIAFQTNILALNAAVEAARAGEHGKGFAVVASEVRKLAENSKLASEEIINLVKESNKLSQKAGTSLEQVIPQIEQTASLIQEISSASNEQNTGAEQVNGAIQQLNQVAQQNAATSEELATTSEQMTAQAEQLKELISFFRI